MARKYVRKNAIPDVEAHRKLTGNMIPCPGEAHKNPFIDNCMVCMPRWGTVPETLPIDLDEAKEKNLDVPMPELTMEQLKLAHELEKAGEVEIVMVSYQKRGAYFVMRWIK